jgi:thiosulfate/3-mercaptopyruvate sulfurtransferase
MSHHSGSPDKGYAHPETVVTTDWVAGHRSDPNVRLIEVDVDTTAFDQGHIPGAAALNWKTELQDQLTRDIAPREVVEGLLSRLGVGPDTTIVLYGDNNNWFGAYAFWLLKVYGHKDVRVMDGGRKKWIDEGREVTTDVVEYPRTEYRAQAPDLSIRAFRDEVRQVLGKPDYALVDVRSPAEFTGEILAPPGLPETAQRGGHIPGAQNIPWSQAVQDDGTFKPADQLRELYGGKGITPDKNIVAYCRIGERSSHTWFVLKYLLGFQNVRNYDGSWTEWGSVIGAPIEK